MSEGAIEVGAPPLRLTGAQRDAIVDHCRAAVFEQWGEQFLIEACGLLAGPMVGGEPTGEITQVYPCRNAEESARLYTVDSRDLLRAMRDAEERGDEIVGVWHSHTHTEAFPSQTDVRQAADPAWFYVIVSLRDDEPVLRAFRIRDEQIAEVEVSVAGWGPPTGGVVGEESTTV